MTKDEILPKPLQTITKSFDENSLIVKIEETGSWCNLCASYKISVFQDGKTIFEGTEFVEKNTSKGKTYVRNIQTAESKLSKNESENLINEFNNTKFFELADRYLPDANCPENLADFATIHFSFQNEQKSKTVRYYQGCKGSNELEKLANLKRYVDKTFKKSDWLLKSIMINPAVLSESIEQITK